MRLTVEEQNLLSMYVDDNSSRRTAIFDLQDVTVLCDDYEMLFLISELIDKLEHITDEEFSVLISDISFTEPDE